MKTLQMMRSSTAGQYDVKATPAICLGKVRAFLDSEDWPYEAKQVHGPDITGRTVSASLPGHLFMGSCLGLALLAVLSIVTLGTFFLLWAIVAWLVSLELGPTVQVDATIVDEGITRLKVTTNSVEHADPVLRWIEQEFVLAESNQAS